MVTTVCALCVEGSVLGNCFVSLSLFICSGYFPLDFSYFVGSKRNDENPIVVYCAPGASGDRCDMKLWYIQTSSWL